LYHPGAESETTGNIVSSWNTFWNNGKHCIIMEHDLKQWETLYHPGAHSEAMRNYSSHILNTSNYVLKLHIILSWEQNLRKNELSSPSIYNTHINCILAFQHVLWLITSVLTYGISGTCHWKMVGLQSWYNFGWFQPNAYRVTCNVWDVEAYIWIQKTIQMLVWLGRGGCYTGIPRNCSFVFKLGWVFALFSWVRESD